MGFGYADYVGVRRVRYGEKGAQFVPVCRTCGRFVKADSHVAFNGDGQPVSDNATCSKCGRTSMVFEGYV